MRHAPDLRTVFWTTILLVSACAAPERQLPPLAQPMLSPQVFERWEGTWTARDRSHSFELVLTAEGTIYGNGGGMRFSKTFTDSMFSSLPGDPSPFLGVRQDSSVIDFGFGLLGRITSRTEIEGTVQGGCCTGTSRIVICGEWRRPMSGTIDMLDGTMSGTSVAEPGDGWGLFDIPTVTWEAHRVSEPMGFYVFWIIPEEPLSRAVPSRWLIGKPPG